MAGTANLPDAYVSAYWAEVKAALLAAGMMPAVADGAIRDFRVHVEPAKWTVYNDEPEDVAEELQAWLLGRVPAPDDGRDELPIRTRSDFYAELARRSGLSKSDVKRIAQALVEVAIRELGSGGPGEFTLPGLARFVVRREPDLERRLNGAVEGHRVVRGTASVRIRFLPLTGQTRNGSHGATPIRRTANRTSA